MKNAFIFMMVIVYLIIFSAPVLACGVCMQAAFFHGFPFIMSWLVLLLFYSIWDLNFLEYVRKSVSSCESEIINYRLINIKLFIRKILLVVLLCSLLCFPFAGLVLPVFILIVLGGINFFGSFIFLLSNFSGLGYNIKLRYIVIQIVILLLMAGTYYIGVNRIPGQGLVDVINSI